MEKEQKNKQKQNRINRSDSALADGGDSTGFELPTSIVSAAPHIFLSAAPSRYR